MFGLVTGVYQTYFGSPELHILLVGAEESGKTALLERLKVTQFSKNAPPTPQTPQRITTTTTTATPKSTSRTTNRMLVSEFQSSSTTTTTPVTTTKMTSNHHEATTNGTTSTSISTSNGATPTTTTTISNTTQTTTNKFLSLACPAPSRYANAKEQQQEEDDDYEEEHENIPINSPIHVNNQLIRQKLAWLHEKQTSSLESVMNGDETNFVQENHPRTPFSSPTQQTPTFMENSNNNNTPQYHLKTGRKMLPLEKIRPTSGQNIAKLDICGAKCVILDVSGKFQDLWERYYADADAVIFCWRLDHPPQHALLEKVRHEISDDVPFLIFGHEFDLTTATKTQSSTTPLPQHESNFTSTFSSPTTLPTEWFLPHYHSNLMMAFCGSAHNGAGVRDAMEWLIPLAKRQAKLRVTIPIPEDR